MSIRGRFMQPYDHIDIRNEYYFDPHCKIFRCARNDCYDIQLIYDQHGRVMIRGVGIPMDAMLSIDDPRRGYLRFDSHSVPEFWIEFDTRCY
jgi:hypothetical protein